MLHSSTCAPPLVHPSTVHHFDLHPLLVAWRQWAAPARTRSECYDSQVEAVVCLLATAANCQLLLLLLPPFLLQPSEFVDSATFPSRMLTLHFVNAGLDQ